MDDRRQDAGWNDRPGRQQQSGDYSQRQGAVTTQGRQEREADRWSGQGGQGGQGSGEWQGYVVPYRYYGPGYRGVGYYSVMYQGPGGREGEGVGDDERSFSQGGGSQGNWSQGQGGFAGRGPKGYQRSDDRLREEVSDRLMEDDALDASDIEVKVRGGEVTLTGTVPDRGMKRRAEDCAERVMGVRDVMNQVRVQGERDATSAGGTSAGRSRSGQATRGGQEHPANGQREAASTGPR